VSIAANVLGKITGFLGKKYRVRLVRFVSAAAGFALGACGAGGSNAPAGWQPMPGASASWTNGSGAARQLYSYEKRFYNGSLRDLASREVVDTLLHYRGARYVRSVPFAPCPGLAAVQTFALSDGATLQRGFAAQPNGQAVIVSYVRPGRKPVDPSVARAMESALCRAPL
jgi:hypothetical protein